jgi:uncharacterized protein YdeI (YjbR/CyaY-like superfamily)
MTRYLTDRIMIDPGSRKELRNWLKKNHLQETGVWVIHGKKANTQNLLRYEDVRDECLCFGWVDSLPRSLDEIHTMIYVSPRKKNSIWSALNKQVVARLIEQGLMEKAGFEQIESAKQNGMWEMYDDLDTIPNDLMEAISKNLAIQKKYLGFSPGKKRNFHLSLKLTKNPETRKKRIQKILNELG